MPINFVWDDDEQSIIRWDFSDPWNWDEFRAAFEQSVEIGGNIGRRVDVIPYVGNSKMPVPTGAIGEFSRIARRTPPNTALIVITGGNAFANAVISVFTKIYRQVSAVACDRSAGEGANDDRQRPRQIRG
jgi:hypothetical protein